MATTVLRTATFEQWRTATNQISTDLGTVASLTTTDKTSLVNAANELKTNVGTMSLATAATNLTDAVNELKNSSITFAGTKTFSSSVNLTAGNSIVIDGATVLSKTSLGSGVVGSSLTSVGTIGTGVWQGTIIDSTYGGTGVNNGGRTITLNTGNLTLTAQAGGSSVTVPSTGTLATLAGAETLTTKTINLTSNTLTGTLAQFNTALSDDDFAALSASQTLTNKTIALGTNTITGTLAQFNTALTDDDFAALAASQTLTNKTVNLANNTVTGTLAQFNTALSDDDFAALAAAQTLTNKSLVDGSTFVVNSTDSSKKAQFSSASISANTTRTLTIPNNSGTIALAADTTYLGTTAITLSRASANQALTGILSVALPGSTSGTVTLQPAAIAGTTTITLPATTGTVVTTGDTGTVTNTMLAGSIANAKLVNSTISGVALGSNLNALTLGDGLDGTSYNGTAAITAAVNSSIARRADTTYIGTTGVALNRASSNLALAGITSVAMPGSTSGTITLQPAAIAGTTTLTLPSGTGTILSDQSAISGSQLVAGSVAVSKLASTTVTIGSTPVTLGGAAVTAFTGLTSVTSTAFAGALTGNASTATTLQTARNINGVAFNGSADITITSATSNALTVGSGIQLNSGTTFDGSSAKTISVDSSVALRADTTYIGATGIALNRASGNLALTGILSVTLPGSTSGSVQLIPTAAAGTNTVLTLPAASGTVLTTASAIDGAQLNNTSVANAKLVNSSVTIGSTGIALGATATTLAGLTSVTSTGFTGALTGNATTATALQTARTINGVSFDGSANITIGASTTAALTIGTGLALDSGTTFNGSTARTLTNAGVTSLAGTANRITVSGATGSVTLNLPQDIATSSTPTFAGETLTGAIAQNVNIADASKSNVYTLTNSNANYTANPTRFAMDSAGNVTISGNLTVSGTTSLQATNYVPDWSAVTNKQYYGQIKDGTTTAVAATNIANGDAIWFREIGRAHV